MASSVDRSVTLLQLLAVRDDGLSVSEAAQLLRVSTSSASRTLQGMREVGAVVRDEDGRLHIAVGMWPLGAAALRQIPFRRVALPAIATMLPEIGRPVNVGVPDLDNAISVERLDLLGRMVFSSPFGKRVPYHAGTLGKAILAFADESLRMRILGSKLARFTERTITDPEKLEIELAETRRLGFSKNRAEFREGGYAVGVPLLNSKGIPVGALSTPASEEEMAPANHVVRSLVNLGRSISAQLGHTDGAGFE